MFWLPCKTAMGRLYTILIAPVSRAPMVAHAALWGLVAVLMVPFIAAGGFWWTNETRHEWVAYSSWTWCEICLSRTRWSTHFGLDPFPRTFG